MESLMMFCLERLDKNGFASGVDGDWIFIDWADIDKNGAVSAEQMLLLESLNAMVYCAELVGVDSAFYKKTACDLKEKINEFFWDEKKGAYIDSFESGKKNVTRHANIFALHFNIANESQKKSIIENVLQNDDIPKISTPYFKFYELESLCEVAKFDTVFEEIKSYWGGMLDNGATTFWEEYNPQITGTAQYEMYGEKYGKSLCHAWGSSPIYLLGRYFLGVKPLSPGYASFEVRPMLDHFENLEATIPVGDGNVTIRKTNNKLIVLSNKDGGILIYDETKYLLEKDKEICIDLK